MKGPTSEELHSPDETPVLGAECETNVNHTNDAVHYLRVAARGGVFTEQTLLRIRSGLDRAAPLNDAFGKIALINAIINNPEIAHRVGFFSLLRMVHSRIVLEMMWEWEPMYAEVKREQFSTNDESIML